MHDNRAAAHPAAPPNRRREVLAAGQSGRSRQQRDRSRRMRQADSSERPLRRRAAMIARPARVRMRNRNPWVLARRRLFGWNVRLPLLTAVVLPVLGARFEIAGSQPSGLRRWSCRRLPAQVALRARRPHPVSEGESAVGEGTQEYPPVGGRRPELRRPVAVPSKPTSRVTVGATRRYIGGACLHGVLVAAPQAC
jgi:hypothetical protein